MTCHDHNTAFYLISVTKCIKGPADTDGFTICFYTDGFVVCLFDPVIEFDAWFFSGAKQCFSLFDFTEPGNTIVLKPFLKTFSNTRKFFDRYVFYKFIYIFNFIDIERFGKPGSDFGNPFALADAD